MVRRHALVVLAALAVAAVVISITVMVNRGSVSPASAADLAVGSGGGAGDGGTEPGNVGGGGSAGEPASGAKAEPPGGARSAGPAAGGTSDRRTIAIADARLNTAGELVVGYYVGVPECYGQLGDVDIEQGANRVTVTLTSAPDPTTPSDTACIDIALAKSVVVDLDSPLGDRTLIDGSTGEPIAVG